MTTSASLPMPRRTEAAPVAPSQAARPTARAANPAATEGGEVERPASRRSPLKASGNDHTLATELPSLTFAAAVAAALIYGWQMRDEGHLMSASGVGYWVGIGGASPMLLRLGYPQRKRLTGLKILGSVTGWFRLHMMLGVIGPALILLHANFKLGSLNSNIALLAMLSVVSSGLTGRYLYGCIHNFTLPGSHKRASCNGCHAKNTKYRETPGRCFDCHRSIDPHKGRLGKGAKAVTARRPEGA